MKTLEAHFADYAMHHQTAGNKVCHRIGIPMIMFSLLGMLAAVKLGTIGGFTLDAAIVLIAAVTLYYLVLAIDFGLVMLIVSVAMYLGGRLVPMPVLVALFVIGWILQFIGHGVYEKRRPAFFKNFVHLLVGPLWILNDVIPLRRMPRSAA